VTKSAVVDLTFGVSQTKCEEVPGMYGNYQDCGLVIPVSGRVTETSDGRVFTVQGAAHDMHGFAIWFYPIGGDGAPTSTLTGCVELRIRVLRRQGSPGPRGQSRRAVPLTARRGAGAHLGQ
jgi:hypothetical protein